MKTITVNGGRPLFGSVFAQGSKNAALPIIFATLITRGVSEVRHLPDIGDVRCALDIIRELGARVTSYGSVAYIDTRSLSFCEPSAEKISKIRASTYLLGSMLSRFGRCRLSAFGGCAFSDRPIDMHIDACLAFGGRIVGNEIITDRLHPADISFKKASVGATINALILAAATDGVSTVRGHAREPHVHALIDFLRSAGAEIKISDELITVRGGELKGGNIAIIGDMIEAGSYLTAGLITGGRVSVIGADREDLSSYLALARELGCEVFERGSIISARATELCRRVSIVAEPYPAFATDLQPIIAPLLAVMSGGEICDRVWTGRYGYLKTLSSFGLSSRIEDGRAIIESSELQPACVVAEDLRGGMAALLCGLCAKGESRIENAEQILRGYENLVYKLRSLGADVSID
ncbi:MAG: UDP-N-acetylglucosamine 1-carboxyvinyltransferase [Clostridia bacterium]|nr:UDP-N-acetylglucosamine 1-carboxyvinyltransferase [Clostridia bacterium]